MKTGLIVEDLEPAQAWLADALMLAFPGIQVRIAPDVRRAMKLVALENPDIALVDLNLPDGSGASVIAAIKGRHPAAFVIVTSIYNDDEHLFPSLQAGANGYLLKEEGKDRIAEALRKIKGGEPPLSPQIARRLMGFFHSGGATPPEKLTDREEEILRFIAKGYTLQETAEQLGVTRNTVATYVKRIYKKLEISSRSEATIEAARRGIITTKI